MGTCRYCKNPCAAGSHCECVDEFSRRLTNTYVRCNKPTGGGALPGCNESGPAPYGGYPEGGAA